MVPSQVQLGGAQSCAGGHPPPRDHHGPSSVCLLHTHPALPVCIPYLEITKVIQRSVSECVCACVMCMYMCVAVVVSSHRLVVFNLITH